MFTHKRVNPFTLPTSLLSIKQKNLAQNQYLVAYADAEGNVFLEFYNGGYIRHPTILNLPGNYQHTVASPVCRIHVGRTVLTPLQSEWK